METATDVVEAVEQCTEFRARSGACEVEVERELEVTSGDGAALKFHEVDIQGVDAFQHAIQGARFAFERELDGRLVGTWVHGGLPRDDDEPGVVGIGVLDVALNGVQAVQLGAWQRRKCGKVAPARRGDELGSAGGVLAYGGPHTEVLEVASALVKCLIVGDDLFDLIALNAGEGEQVVVDFQPQRPHDRTSVGAKQIVHGVDGAAVEFSMGSTPNSHAPETTARNTPSKVGEKLMSGIENSLLAAIWL